MFLTFYVFSIGHHGVAPAESHVPEHWCTRRWETWPCHPSPAGFTPPRAEFTPKADPKLSSRRAPSAVSSRFPFLSLLLTCPFNAFSHLGFKLASCRLGLLRRFASSLLGVSTIICLGFFLLCYTYIWLKLILHSLSNSYAWVQWRFAAGFATLKGMLTFMKCFYSPLILQTRM